MFRTPRAKSARFRDRGGVGPLAVPHEQKVQLKRLQEDPDVVATRSLLSLSAASPANNESKQESNDVHANASEEAELWGRALEYAAGATLRTLVLEPTLSDFSDASQAETTRLLARNCKGESLLITTGSSHTVKQASMERIQSKDADILSAWWNDDKYLSFTDPTWSEWWVRRCQMLDPGCEMYKLKTEDGETLGVVYFERNILDHHEFGNKGRITLIRGIRVAPKFNPQVEKRKNMASSDAGNFSTGTGYKRIMSLLFHHVLYMSVRFGSNGIGVNCPKVLEMERFYETTMGKSVAFDKSGRRYYRLGNSGRWRVLRRAFHNQVELWLDQKNSTTTGKRKNSS